MCFKNGLINALINNFGRCVPVSSPVHFFCTVLKICSRKQAVRRNLEKFDIKNERTNFCFFFFLPFFSLANSVSFLPISSTNCRWNTYIAESEQIALNYFDGIATRQLIMILPLVLLLLHQLLCLPDQYLVLQSG